MTRKEFLTGQPFQIEGVPGALKYAEQTGGEILILINKSWKYKYIVTVISDESFTVGAIVRDGVEKRNYRIRYDECKTFVEMF